MTRYLLILPAGWDVEMIRYQQHDIDQPYIVDMDTMASPLESEYSYLNYKSYVVKRNGPTGFPPT